MAPRHDDGIGMAHSALRLHERLPRTGLQVFPHVIRRVLDFDVGQPAQPLTRLHGSRKAMSPFQQSDGFDEDFVRYEDGLGRRERGPGGRVAGIRRVEESENSGRVGHPQRFQRSGMVR